MPPASDDPARTRTLFEQWRSTRKSRSKIPEELWQAVIALHGRYSASQLCHELHLSAGALRSRLREGAKEKPPSPVPAFVPLPMESLGGGHSGAVAGSCRRDPLGLGAGRRHAFTYLSAGFASGASRLALHYLLAFLEHAAVGPAVTHFARRRTGRLSQRNGCLGRALP